MSPVSHVTLPLSAVVNRGGRAAWYEEQRLGPFAVLLYWKKSHSSEH